MDSKHTWRMQLLCFTSTTMSQVQEVFISKTKKHPQTNLSGFRVAAWLKSAFSVILYICLPNFVFWLLTSTLHLDRPIFNLDYLFIAIIAAFGFSITAILLLIIFITADILVVLGLLYPFVRFQDIFYLLSLTPQASTFWQILLAISICLLAITVILAYRWAKHLNRLLILCIFNLFIILYGYNLYGNPMNHDKYYRGSTGLIKSQILFLVDTRTNDFISAFRGRGDPLHKIGYRNATKQWMENIDKSLNKKLLLIVVESWGVMRDARVNATLLKPITENSSIFNWVKIREKSGSSATVQAELSELCGLTAHHFNLKNIKTGFEECLPNKLIAEGYSTRAFHGAPGVMYDRMHWYPRAGFEKSYFRETSGWASQCYSFPGACDREIMSDIKFDSKNNGKKEFIYWLTLNSHAPYDKRDIDQDIFDCSRFNLDIDGEICRMNKIHAQFFDRLGKILSEPNMRGTEVIMIGDHSPRIFDKNAEDRYIKKGRVMEVHLQVAD